MAGLTSPSELALSSGLSFLYSCFWGRRYGHWLSFLPQNRSYRLLRSDVAERSSLELAVPACHLSRFSLLQPVRLLRAWNALPLLELFPAAFEGRLPSLAAFRRALPPLLSRLPDAIRKDYGLSVAF